MGLTSYKILEKIFSDENEYGGWIWYSQVSQRQKTCYWLCWNTLFAGTCWSFRCWCVLAYTIADSIFGALGLPDIGQQFPDDVSWTKDIDSKIILQHAAYQVEQHGCNISNIDSVIIAQEPRLAGYIPAIQFSISEILKINTDAIGIKAKTNEGICTIGHGKAIAAISNCLLIEWLWHYIKFLR